MTIPRDVPLFHMHIILSRHGESTKYEQPKTAADHFGVATELVVTDADTLDCDPVSRHA